jgi:hypothetical protein
MTAWQSDQKMQGASDRAGFQKGVMGWRSGWEGVDGAGRMCDSLSSCNKSHSIFQVCPKLTVEGGFHSVFTAIVG